MTSLDIKFDGDIEIANGDLVVDNTLYNFYQFSIFTNLSQYWGDKTLGSKLYKYSTVITDDILLEIESVISDSIRWIKQDGLVSSQEVSIWQDDTAVKFVIDSILPDNSKYKIGWEI